MRRIAPHRIRRLDTGLEVEWDTAGHAAFFPARELRLRCPCAECVEEMTGRRLLQPASVPADVRPVAAGLVGSYGLRLQWSDGHGTGIYTFEWLRRECPCPRCRPGAVGGEPPPG